MKTNFQNREQLEKCLTEIVDRIERRAEIISNRELIEICGERGSFLSCDTDPHFCHEIAEAAINLLIKEKYAEEFFHARPPEFCTPILKTLIARLPTQTWRSREQIIRQQFSTPPAIAYFLTYLLNLKPGDQILEPSAGTGSLAAWANGLGLKIYTNEIDLRRRELLEVLGFQPTAYNAEFINDFLSSDVRANVVMMNPPFSSSGGRTKNNSSKFGFRHVESALERLKKGGKFGVILGEAAGLDTKTGNDFWRKHSDRIEVSAVIKINGREYARYGTTVDINLIIGKKFLVPQRTDWNQMLNKIICFSANTVEEVFAKAETFNLRLNQ